MLKLCSLSLLVQKPIYLLKWRFSGVVSSCGFSGFVESPHCEIGFPKALFGVVSSFSAALFVPRGFID
ncbi:hypothetical protein ACN930_004796 [Vibrio parahaemolyticus]|nr:hypothetical protein [Vibrio parahaemolyticus]